MKLVVQRVSQASVSVNDEVVGCIPQGLLVLLGITHTDTFSHVSWLANKLVNLRIFEDAQGKMNRSLLDMQGQVLIISQFTLYGDCHEGRRPSFTQAASPTLAQPLYTQFVEEVRKAGVVVQTGIFGAEMQVSLVNDGPVTMILER